MTIWGNILRSVSLSNAEKEILSRFEKNSTGRGFLPVSDILYINGFTDEAIELLLDGTTRYPTYIVAKVVLARYQYEKGLFNSAWEVLTSDLRAFSENILAQNILFRLSVILKSESEARKILRHIHSHRLNDSDINALEKQLEDEGFQRLRRFLLSGYNLKKIELGDSGDSGNANKTDFSSLAYDESAPALQRKLDTDYSSFGSFHAVPLGEIFSPAESVDEATDLNGIELDSTTLAEIFEKQHHYGRALEIYKRLQKVSPNHDLVKRKILELSRKIREQEGQGLGLDHSVVDDMESVRNINKKIGFLEGILERLN